MNLEQLEIGQRVQIKYRTYNTNEPKARWLRNLTIEGITKQCMIFSQRNRNYTINKEDIIAVYGD